MAVSPPDPDWYNRLLAQAEAIAHSRAAVFLPEIRSDWKIDGGQISLPNFGISWACGSPWRPGYCFGSDDGRVQFTGLDSVATTGPDEVAPSKDAINGIAFAGDLMAASTRSDVTFLNVPLGGGHLELAFFFGGAHGVAATQSGKIIAPMGKQGILQMGTKQGKAQTVRILKAADESFYSYKVVSLASPDRGEILACAGRRGGFAAMPLAGSRLENYGKWLRPAGVDFVDVAAVGVGGFPFAVAALSLDCSIHVICDLLVDKTSKRLDFGLDGQRAYRLLCSEGHVFMLTDKRLYAFAHLATKILGGEAIALRTPARKLDLEAVDVSLAYDRSLLVVMTDCVYRIAIDSLIAGADSRDGNSQGTLQSTTGDGMLPTSSSEESWETSDSSVLNPSKEEALAQVA